jgi:glycerophosphoryl diester phosphodiesterase
VLIVLHDLYLEAVTDVEEAFPGRNREDGHYYAIDFTLEEIRRLRVHERLERGGRAKFPGRFPAGHRLFSVPTLEEEIRLIEGLNQSTGRRAGLYIEPKATAWHRAEGRDLMREVLELLRRLGYASRDDPVYLQTFDFEALRRAREELGSKLRLVQLIGENSWRESSTDFDQLRTDAGLSELARFADGIGPWLPQVLRTGAEGRGEGRGLAARARALGLDVHAYTLRADQLPAGYPDVGSLLQALAAAGVNGVFTDHPDQVRRHLYRGHDD